MAVQIGCPPASPVLLSPTTCRDILGNPVGRRDHGQRQDAECGHPLLPVDARTPALARRLHDPRAHGVPGKYRKIIRPLPPPAAPTLSPTPRQSKRRGPSHGLRSYGMPGSYVTSHTMRAGSHALPRLRTLYTHAKHPRDSGSFSWEMPRCGGNNCARATSILPLYAHGRHTRRRHRHRTSDGSPPAPPCEAPPAMTHTLSRRNAVFLLDFGWSVVYLHGQRTGAHACGADACLIGRRNVHISAPGTASPQCDP